MRSIIKHDKFKTIVFCFLVAFFILLFTSKCSPLYPFNDWVDANAFFSMGKGMMHGLVPYKDLFEQKGPLLFLLYGLGYLISNNSFLGIFGIEVIFWTISLYYAFKTINLFLSKNYSYIILPIFMCLCAVTPAFVHGGGAEELCFPFLSYTLYVFLAHFKGDKVTPMRLFWAGIGAGAIFLIKYTLLGFFFAFMACLFFDMVFDKKYKKAFFACIYFLMGMFLPIIITLVYLGLNGAIKDFIDVYILINFTAYNRESLSFIVKIWEIFKGFVGATYNSSFMDFILLMGYPFLIWLLKLDKRGNKCLLIIYLFSIFTVYFGLRFYKYYLYGMVIFEIISLICIFDLLSKVSKIEKKVANKKVTNVLIVFSIIISLGGAYFFANYKELRFQKKEDLFQYKFAQIINQEENPTLVEMGYVDCGVFTMANVVPSTYYFEKLNFSYDNYPDNIDYLRRYIKEKETMFIVYFTKWKQEFLELYEPKLFDNYKLVAQDSVKYDGKRIYAYLFKVR